MLTTSVADVPSSKTHIKAKRRSYGKSSTMIFRVALELPSSGFETVLDALFHSDGTLTRKAAAGMMHLSEGRFSREFKRVCGIAFRNARLVAKLRKSAELLYGTDLSIEEIAEATGYTEAGPFHKAFRRTYGLSPSQFRKTKCVAANAQTISKVSFCVHVNAIDPESPRERVMQLIIDVHLSDARFASIFEALIRTRFASIFEALIR